MNYKVGDCVVHPTHGVGYIVGLAEKTFFEAEARRYYEISISKGIVWVPVEPHETSGLRPVTARDDLNRYRTLLKSAPGSLNQDRRQRQVELSERLKQGTFQSLCEVVRDLTARGWHTSLSEPDLAALRRVQEILCQEWSVASGLSVAEAAQEVEALLQEARLAFQD